MAKLKKCPTPIRHFNKALRKPFTLRCAATSVRRTSICVRRHGNVYRQQCARSRAGIQRSRVPMGFRFTNIYYTKVIVQ